MALLDIRSMAANNGWVEIDHQTNISMISFIKDKQRINVYYCKEWKMTVATVIDHPVVGRKQLFRKYIKMPELEKIFKNPRVHTCKGFYTR